MSGMVGSKQGWAEAPYVPCPAGIADLARAVMPVPGENGVSIVPGISFEAPDGRHDVMRGEEVRFSARWQRVERAGRSSACPALTRNGPRSRTGV